MDSTQLAGTSRRGVHCILLESGVQQESIVRIAGDLIEINGNTTFASGYDPSSKAQTYRQSSAPSSANAGDLWIDTANDDTLKRYTGSSWVKAITVIDGGDIKTGSVSLDKLTASGSVQSANYDEGAAGFKIDAGTGDAEFNSVTVRGTVHASTGSLGTLTIGGALSMGSDGTISGDGYTLSKGGIQLPLESSIQPSRTIQWAGGPTAGVGITGYVKTEGVVDFSTARVFGDVVELNATDFIDAPAPMRIGSQSSLSVTATSVLWNNGGTLKWENATIWTSANDGTGSGLDADLLDGNQASAFAASSHTHSASAITSGTFDEARLPATVITTSSNLNALGDVSGTPSANQILQRQSGVWQPATVQNAMTNALGGPVPWIQSGFLKFSASATSSSPPVSQTNTFIPVDMNGSTYYIRLYAV